MFGHVVRNLKKNYSIEFFNEKNDPYRVLISCLISLRTKDEVTGPASKRLFKLASSPRSMIKLSVKQIEKAIYPAGFYITKAKRIKDISRTLIEKYKGRVPNEIEELLKFKGVGRKTANIVVTYGHGLPGMAVDTHVHRISNRMGWVGTETPEKTEFELRRIMPKKYWIDLNELLVKHGQNICRPISPWCSKCNIFKYCKRVGVGRSR